jgi:hypothetical protein
MVFVDMISSVYVCVFNDTPVREPADTRQHSWYHEAGGSRAHQILKERKAGGSWKSIAASATAGTISSSPNFTFAIAIAKMAELGGVVSLSRSFGGFIRKWDWWDNILSVIRGKQIENKISDLLHFFRPYKTDCSTDELFFKGIDPVSLHITWMIQ